MDIPNLYMLGCIPYIHICIYIWILGVKINSLLVIREDLVTPSSKSLAPKVNFLANDVYSPKNLIFSLEKDVVMLIRKHQYFKTMLLPDDQTYDIAFYT